MATGDKNIFAFANRDSLQYKRSRAYGSGSICVRGGLFYEANNDIPANANFAEGTTGATWKLVGSKPIDDWSYSSSYKVGEQVFFKEALWEANKDLASNVAWTTSNWTLKAGLINSQYFNLNIATKEFSPLTGNEWHLGTAGDPFEGVHTQYINFYSTSGAGATLTHTNEGNIDADPDSLGLFGTTELRLGQGNNSDDIKINSTAIYLDKDMVVTNGIGLRFEDSDTSNNEYLEFRMNGNDLALYGALNGSEYSDPHVEFPYNGGIEVNAGVVDLNGVRLDINNDSGTKRGYLSCIDSGLVINTGDDDEAIFIGVDGIWNHKIFRAGADDIRIIPNTGYGSRYLGDSDNRYTRLYSVSSANVSSDKRYKSDISDLPNELLDVWFDYVKPKSYYIKTNGKVAETRAIGVIAQDVIEAFNKAGLDWKEWDIIEEDNQGYLSLSYDAVQVVEMAAIRRKLGV